MGRNMFGPVGGGDWGNGEWKGWWGDTPPYRYDIFVVTHHPREPVAMDGGTTYHFVTAGIERALEQAKEAAGGSRCGPVALGLAPVSARVRGASDALGCPRCDAPRPEPSERTPLS
jgi:hypothetical protein